MNPTRLRLHGFRCYDDVDLSFPEGCIAITGPNGSGKSSLILGLDVALFGSRSLGDFLSDDAADTEMFVELEFDHSGESYRVRRSYSARGRGKSATDFEKLNGDGWEPLSRESQAETQTAIEEVLGLSRDTLHASALLMQGQGGLWTEAQPKDRKRVLAEILNLGSWDRLLEACRVDKRSAEREASELAGRIALLEESGGDIDELRRGRDDAGAVVEGLVETHAVAETALAEAAGAVQSLEQAEATYRIGGLAVLTAEARLRERQTVVDRAVAAKLEAVSVQRWLDQTGAPSAEASRLEEERAEMDRARELRRERGVERDKFVAEAEDSRVHAATLASERAQAQALLVIAKEKAAALNDPANAHTCDRCGQEIHGEAYERTLLQIREERDEAERRVAAYGERITESNERERSRRQFAAEVEIPEAPSADAYEEITFAIRRFREAELGVVSMREKLAGLQATIGEVTPELTAEVARLASELVSAQEALAAIDEPEPGALESARADSLTAKTRLDETAARLTESRAALVRAESALEAAQKTALELGNCRQKQAELQGELDLLALLERAYGRDGIPALIVEASAIPSIETEASRILAELGTSYRVELRTQKALKSGDGLADTLDVVVIGDAGERAYETFSGGERTRINLALRIALARLLAHRRGAESRLLAIDEPEFLDEAGTALLAEVLQGLHADFDRIVLVSHVPTLRDAFDQTIEVVKDGNRSRIAA